MDSKPRLDLLFLQDTTGSQQKFIDSVRGSIKEIIAFIKECNIIDPDGFRIGHIAFRDYADENETYLLKVLDFTTDFMKVREHVDSLKATGGDDPAEACEVALYEAQQCQWQRKSVKVAILITDSPPHGTKEKSAKDKYPSGSPKVTNDRDAYDPIQLVVKLAKRGVMLYVLACEPTMSRYYEYARVFYRALATKGNGAMYPLTNSRLLTSAIIGLILEQVKLYEYSLEFQEEIARQIFEQKRPAQEVLQEVVNIIEQHGDKVTTLKTNSSYQETNETIHNFNVWLNAKRITDVNAEQLITAGPHYIPGNSNNYNPERHFDDFEEYVEDSHPPRRAASPSEKAIEITIQNLGENIITFSVYENDQEKMVHVDIRPGFQYKYFFPIHIPINFILICGRKNTSFSRTFTIETAIDVNAIWNGSHLAG